MADESGSGPALEESTQKKVRASMWEGGLGPVWDLFSGGGSVNPAAPPAEPWRINWPGAPAGAGPPAPAPPAPAPPSRGTTGSWDTLQTASTGEPGEARFPPPDDYGVTPDFRDPGGLTGVPVGGSVDLAAKRDLLGAPPAAPGTLAPGALAALSAAGGPAPAAAPAGAPAAPPAPPAPNPFATSVKRMVDAAAEQKAAREQQRVKLEEGLVKRQVLEEFQKQALDAYRGAYNEERPTQPKLKEMPATPDVKIRPWLDPEGKDAISVIAQTLGMLAVGAAGIAYKAPLTAMKYFREAAENWRRDEVDAANSKMKQFEIEVTRLKGNNELMLKQYELADKEYAHNLDAKKAMVLTAADGLKLYDETMRLGQLPYDQAVEASKQDFDNLSKIETHLEKIADLEIKMRKAQGGALAVQKSPFAAIGKLEALKDQIANEPDPAKRVDLEREATILTNQLQKADARDLKRLEANALISVAKTQVPKIEAQLGAMDRFMNDVVRFDDAVRTLAKGGVLPTTPTPMSQWAATARNWFPSKWKDPNLQAALTVVQTLGPDLTVSYARTIENNIGVRHREAFNLPPKWEMMTTAQLSALPRFFSEGAANGRMLLEDRKKLYSQGLPTLGGPPPAEPSPPDETETED